MTPSASSQPEGRTPPEPFFKDEWLEIWGGDSRDVLRGLPAESVHCVVTSPPYWSLRDYGVAGQIGLESTPEKYVAALVEVFREVRRVLRADGTLWLVLGDSYAGSGKGGGGLFEAERPGWAGLRDVPNGPLRSVSADGVLKPKDLVGIPWRVAFALQADGWYLRSDVIWSKPNPMPESVTDRPTKSHDYLFLLAKSERYHYDADAVREAKSGNTHTRGTKWLSGDMVKVAEPGSRTKNNRRFQAAMADQFDVPDRNLRSVWTIATEPYPGAHFATFPRRLVEPCIKAGCPAAALTADGVTRSGVVLDPFAGTGTVGLVAQSLSRRAILVDLNPEYLRQCLARNAQTPLGLGDGVMLAEGEEPPMICDWCFTWYAGEHECDFWPWWRR